MKPALPAVMLLGSVCAAAAGLHDEIVFERRTIDLGAAETCAVADVNGDGRLDILSGENWFEGPRWRKHRYRELFFTNNYIDAFSDLILDANEDGRPDVVHVAWFGRKISWFENPGRAEGLWAEHPIDSGFNIEFAFLVDLDNDGRASEVLPQTAGKGSQLVWYEARGGRFEKHVVAGASEGHGIGAGDVNGDGRSDILTPKGWWEAPADPRSGSWTHHPDFEPMKFPGLGFLFVLDLNGDKRNDILTTYAHDYGIFWLERTAGSQWKKNLIDESWSQAHAVTVVDLNADGRLDFVTGKRFHAHNGRDPGDKEPLGVFWYESRLGSDGALTWKRHIIDYGSRAGGGMQMPVVDIDGDGDLDILAPGKGGLFLFENRGW